MDLREHVAGVADFNGATDAEKIRYFAWFLHDVRSLDAFSSAQIAQCFEEIHLHKPNVAAYLSKMKDRKPPELLSSGGSFRLEKRCRDALSARYARRSASVRVDALLSALPARITDDDERVFLDEALVCFRNGAVRSAVVMTWNLAFSHLCEVVLRKHLAAFNTALPVRFPKADIATIAKRDDFTELKESQVIEVCRSAGIAAKSVIAILREKLDKRNAAAHPSGVVVTQLAAEAFISELVENVVLKL